jgi:ABC-2 type transport system ATP-binding protein
VYITELDVDVLPRTTRQNSADVSATAAGTAESNRYTALLPKEMQQALAHRYAELFEVFVQHRGAISRVTLWGVIDGAVVQESPSGCPARWFRSRCADQPEAPCYGDDGNAMSQGVNRTRLNNRTDDKPYASCAAAISVAGLWKLYGATAAVCDVSFEVGAGQIFGLLGANGAGKTTTLECILGLRQPDRGSIQIHGLDLRTHADQARRLVGAQLQAATLQDRITPRQALDLFGSFYAHSFGSGELLARFDLASKADVAFATLSGGLRQRLFLALALINRPTLLVLDEPTAGLDPQARRTLRSLIGEMRSDGMTVLLSTHDLQEAGEVCDRIAIMDRGRIVAVASPAELIGRSESPARLIVRTSPCLASTVVQALPGVTQAALGERGWILETRAPNRVLAELVQRVDEAGARLLEVELRGPSLEDVFIELTGRPWSAGEPQGEVS